MSRPPESAKVSGALPPASLTDVDSSPRSYWQNVMTVLGGTVMAQAIPILIMPVLTRLVLPAQMGLFSIWQGIVSIAAVLVILRLDVAVTVSGSAAERRAGVTLASRLAVALSLSVMAIVFALHSQMTQWAAGWTSWATLALGLGTWALASSTLWRACSVSLARFKLLSLMRIVTAVSIAAGQLIGVVTLGGALGLAWGYVLGTAAGAWLARFKLNAEIAEGTQAPDHRSQREFLVKNARTPLYAMPAELINNVSQQLPILLLGARFGPEVAGLFALMIRAVDAPVSVFSQSVQDVYKRRALSEYHETGKCRDAFLDTLKVMVLVALLPAGLLLIAGPYLFELVFGAAYRGSGEMAQVLALMVYLRFFASPLGYTLYITEQANRQLFWQIGLLLMTLAACLLPDSADTAVLMYGLGYALMYIVYLWISYRSALGVEAPDRPVSNAS